MEIVFGRGVYVDENTSQAASVEFVCQRQTNYARSSLLKNWRKSPKGFFDKLKQTCVLPQVCFCFQYWLIEKHTGKFRQKMS